MDRGRIGQRWGRVLRRSGTCALGALLAVGTTASPAWAVAPDAPPQPTVTPGNGHILVDYSAPANDGGATIINYTATCTSSDGGATGFASNGGVVQTLVVAGVTNGKTYTCNVHASNADGVGALSPDSASAVPAGAPDAPAKPGVVAGSGQIQVSFVPPADNGSAITSYNASCTSSGGGPGANSGSTSPITVVGVNNGSNYTCTVTATNGVGTGPASPASDTASPVGAPDAPPQPTVSPGDGQIVVNFTAPFANGGPITSYGAECISSDGGASGSNTGGGSPVTVGSLTNGRTYTCVVSATNSVGTSPVSAPSAPLLLAGAPSAPAIPQVGRGGAPSQLVVNFAAPADNGSPITSYNAGCASSDGGAAGANSGSESPITVTGLTNGKTYRCSVSATNGVGAGAASPDSVAIVVGIPNTPAAPTAGPGNTQIIVTFVAPAANGNAITSYGVSCTSSDGGAPGTGTGAASPITVTGLTNGKTYTCTVSATNSVGTSAPSAPSGPTVPNLVPDVPAQPTVVAGNAQITVTYVAPFDNGNPITSYFATCVSSNGGVEGTHGVFAPALTSTVTGLTNGKTYTCTVTASNAIGAGAASPASAAAVPFTVATPPTIGAAMSGNASLKVAFTPNSNNGAAVTAFTATCTSSNGGVTGTASAPSSPITVPGLSNGNLYTCRVSATNAAGTSVGSAASTPVIVGQPGAPKILSVVSGLAKASTGALKVAFHAGPANGGPITQFRVTCTPVATGPTVVATGTGSPILVPGLRTGRAYDCTVVETNFLGTSVESGSMRATVGTPGAPRVLKVMRLASGLALAFRPAINNGNGISTYRARCESSNGGSSAAPLQTTSPIVVTKLSAGKTYTCLVTAVNGRGEGPATKVGPIVTTGPRPASLTSCTGANGSLRVTPGLLLTGSKAHTLKLGAKLGQCTGPYVRAAKIAMTFRSKSPYSCNTAIGKPNGGSGRITWTAPVGLGSSEAAIQLVFGSTNGHTTTARFQGTVTSRANIFTDQHVSGTLTLNRGLDAVTAGGDCSSSTRLQKLTVTGVTLNIS